LRYCLRPALPPALAPCTACGLQCHSCPNCASALSGVFAGLASHALPTRQQQQRQDQEQGGAAAAGAGVIVSPVGRLRSTLPRLSVVTKQQQEGAGSTISTVPTPQRTRFSQAGVTGVTGAGVTSATSAATPGSSWRRAAVFPRALAGAGAAHTSRGQTLWPQWGGAPSGQLQGFLVACPLQRVYCWHWWLLLRRGIAGPASSSSAAGVCQ